MSNVIVLRSTLLIVSVQGITKNNPEREREKSWQQFPLSHDVYMYLVPWPVWTITDQDEE